MENQLTDESIQNKEIENSIEKFISKRKAMQILKAFFLQSGYLRMPNKQRLKLVGQQKYKKGFEIRFVVKNEMELQLIRIAIFVLNYNLSKSFIKSNHYVQPLYGKEVTLKFKRLKEKYIHRSK